MTTMTDSTRRAARRTAWITMTAGAFALGACGDFDVLNTNAPTAEELTSSPTRSVLARAATGVFDGAFNDVGNEIIFYAIYGREGYHLLGNDPREYEEQVHGPPDPAGRHGGIWLGPYAAIRHINTDLRALENASGLTDEEIRASAGFAKTMKAWHMHRLAVRTGEYGIPIDVDRPIDAEPAPFVSFAAAMEAVSDLLDEAYADLQAGGAAFPFPVAPGYTGFSTPQTFAQFNRALATKVLVHRATFVGCSSCWGEASAALAGSFVTEVGLPEALATGVYYGYTGVASERENPISENLSSDRLWVHSSIVTGAQTRPDGTPDLRLTRKVMDAGRDHELQDLRGRHKPVLYNAPGNPAQANPAAHIPWIDNEELLLLRAEIRWHTGDRAGAIADLDLIRQHSGGLGPSGLTAASSDDEFITELLYNRLYSLMWRNGTRWIDARRYNRLNTLPLDRPGDVIFPSMIVPANECAARRLDAPCNPLTAS